MTLGLVTKRWTGEISENPGLVVEDLDHQGTYRSLEASDAAGALPVHSGDLAAVLDDVRDGVLFRYVVFPARGELAALALAYASGFGELASGLCLSKAILLDEAAGELVSLTTWRDRDALREFLGHPEFSAARQRAQPHMGGPPRAESLMLRQ